MKNILLNLFLLSCISFQSCTPETEVTINILETSDVHGNFFPYNFIERKNWDGSLARVHTFIKQQRLTYGDNCLYFDNGDILQGQPTAYYYDFIDTTSIHVAASMLNYLGCNASNMGNHDVETGHKVYDRWISECNFPVLGANTIDVKTEKPYLKPYEIIERDGVKVAVLGMITPAIPCWLPENLWSGLRFDDMIECAKKWVTIIQEKENPDVIVGLFHAGQSGFKLGDVIENESRLVAENVPGFDVVMFGHDHRSECTKIINCVGDSVLLIDPANNANLVSNVLITVKKRGGKVVSKKVSGNLENMDEYEVSTDFMNKFVPQYQAVNNFVSEKIGTIDQTISCTDAFFGPCLFIDFLQELQLNITGADISFNAPLSPHAEIEKGDILMSSMFNLYKYENMLYVMELTGQEVKDYLEMSYALWTNQMTSADDHIMLLREEDNTTDERGHFKNFSFNFDSSAGILYTVNVTKPRGEKITISSMADGTPFDLKKTYKCAINSYRGNGGGDLLTLGAGIPKEELAKRIVFATDKDLRYYLLEYIKEQKDLHPRYLNQWKFIPENIANPALKRDRELLFGHK